MSVEMILILLTGIGLGAIHALDADHVLALLTLNDEGSSRKRIVLLSSFWAFGHGFVLLISGSLLFFFGTLIPQNVQVYAEMGVGLLLIALGVNCLWGLRRASLKVHSHGKVKHIHWQHNDHDKGDNDAPSAENHKPLMVGMLHGLGGSAPVLALIPMSQQIGISVSFSYLLLFSIGVWFSMLSFGLSVAWIQGALEGRYKVLAHCIRPLLGCVSIVFGSLYLVAASS